MASNEIVLPERLDTEQTVQFAKTLDRYMTSKKLTLNFENGCFLSPFSMLFLSAKIRSLKGRNPDLKVEVTNHKMATYPAHMGFFQMFGEPIGRHLGESNGSDHYIPITRISLNDFYVQPQDRYTELGDLIQREADSIARVITRGKPSSKEVFDVLAYSIRELMRNVFEHSGAGDVYYCAQHWPKSDRVEFSIADFGMGVRRGLGTNPNFRYSTDKDAIEFSLLPSVSGKTHLPRTSENWYNSGYGLYMTNRIARNGGGNFLIASGSTAISLSRKTKRNFLTSFPGTAIRFNLRVPELDNLQDQLKQFRTEGFEIAKRISGTQNRPPSAMSLLLRRDYAR